MRGHNVCFYCVIRKIIFQLSSILPLIWSSVPVALAVYDLECCQTDVRMIIQCLIALAEIAEMMDC